MTVPWIVLCEGYHDRAFWQGLLERRFQLAKAEQDDDQKVIRDGHYGYRSRSGRLVRIAPHNKIPDKATGKAKKLEGRESLPARCRYYLGRRSTDPVSLVLCSDEDAAASASDAQVRAARVLADLADVPHAAPKMRLADGTELRAITWAATDPDSHALPPAQCLERLIVASINAAYPPRATAVATWIASRQDVPTGASAISKAFSWSHMAGWYAAGGCETFLAGVWQDAVIAAELEHRLRQTEAWSIIEEIVG